MNPGGVKMRRPFGILLAAAIAVSTVAQHAHATPAPEEQAAQPAAPQKITFDGDVVLWAFTVLPDKTADYEQVLAKLKAALHKIDRPEVKQQLASWKIIKNKDPQPDGSILYLHMLTPPVKGADYTITNLVYEAFTDANERKAFYDLYRGSLKSALFTIQAPIVADMSK
jgi:hypothetical protein